MTISKRWELFLFLFSAATVSYMLRVNISVCAQKMRDELGWTDTQKGFVLSAFFWGYAVGQIPSTLVADKLGGKFTLGFAIVGSSFFTLLVPLASRSSFAAALVVRALIGLAQAATFPSCFYFYPRWVPVKEKTVLITFNLAGMYMGEILGFGLSGALVSADVTLGGHLFKGWEVVFYVFGAIGFLWFPLYYWRVFDNPDVHPGCLTEEVAIIKEGNCFYDPLLLLGTNCGEEDTDSTPLLAEEAARHSTSSNTSRLSQRSQSRSFSEAITAGSDAPILEGFVGVDKEVRVSFSENPNSKIELRHESVEASLHNRSFASKPWRQIFTHPASVTLLLNFWTFGWIGYMVLTEMPSFLNDELGYDLSEAGLLSVLPYIFNFASVMTSGRLFDYLLREKGWGVRDVRQWANRIAFIGASGSLVISGYMASPGVAFVFMNVGLSFFGFVVSGVNCAFLEVSPNFSSTINTVANMVGAIAGFVGPMIVSLCLLIFESSELAWRMVFFITSVFALLSLLHWHIYQTSEVVPALNNPVKQR